MWNDHMTIQIKQLSQGENTLTYFFCLNTQTDTKTDKLTLVGWFQYSSLTLTTSFTSSLIKIIKVLLRMYVRSSTVVLCRVNYQFSSNYRFSSQFSLQRCRRPPSCCWRHTPRDAPNAALLLQTKTGLHQSSQTDCILFSMTPFEQSYIGFLAVQPLARQYSVVSQYTYQDSKLMLSALLNWFKLVHGPFTKQ